MLLTLKPSYWYTRHQRLMYYMWKTNETFGQCVSYAEQVVHPIELSDWTTCWKNKCRTLPWLLASLGHQHPWYWICGIGKFLSNIWRISTTFVMSGWRNGIGDTYTLFLMNNSACERLICLLQINKLLWFLVSWKCPSTWSVPWISKR